MSQAINSFGMANQAKNNMVGDYLRTYIDLILLLLQGNFPVLPSPNKAGALLDSLQSPEARAISQSLTNAVMSGRLPVASLMELASALAPQPTPGGQSAGALTAASQAQNASEGPVQEGVKPSVGCN